MNTVETAKKPVSKRAYQIFEVRKSENLQPVQPRLNQFMYMQRNLGNQGFQDFIQAKLKIGQPNDKYEHEADRIAEQVMRMPVTAIQPKPG